MTYKYEDIPKHNLKKARGILLDYFKGSFPAYFSERIDEEMYTQILAENLADIEKGELTQEEFDAAQQRCFDNIEKMEGLLKAQHFDLTDRTGAFWAMPPKDKSKLH